MTVPGRRQIRLQDQIQTEVAEMVALELKDPRIGFATVTRVELSPDFCSAHIWVSVLGEKEAQEGTLEGLLSATGYLRHELSHRLRLLDFCITRRFSGRWLRFWRWFFNS